MPASSQPHFSLGRKPEEEGEACWHRAALGSSASALFLQARLPPAGRSWQGSELAFLPVLCRRPFWAASAAKAPRAFQRSSARRSRSRPAKESFASCLCSRPLGSAPPRLRRRRGFLAVQGKAFLNLGWPLGTAPARHSLSQSVFRAEGSAAGQSGASQPPPSPCTDGQPLLGRILRAGGSRVESFPGGEVWALDPLAPLTASVEQGWGSRPA